MKKIVSLLLAIMLLSAAIPAFAGDVNIKIDGESFIPKNALGEEVFPFIKDGSTFLPVRAMGEAVGKTVWFDDGNYAVYIGDAPDSEVVNKTAIMLIGDKVFYEESLKIFSSKETLVQVEKAVKLAQSKFSAPEIEKRKAEIKATLSPEEIEWLGSDDLVEDYVSYEACCDLLIENTVIEDAYYEDFVTVKHILVKEKSVAEEIIKRLSDNEKIEDLIDAYNIDGGQSRDTNYTFTYNEMVEEFEKAAFELGENEFTKTPVETRYGYHVIMRLPLDREKVDNTHRENIRRIREEIESVNIDKIVDIQRGSYGSIDGVEITYDDLKFMFGTHDTSSTSFETLKMLMATSKYYDNKEALKGDKALHKAEMRASLGYTNETLTEKEEFLLDITATYSLLLMKESSAEGIDDAMAQEIEEIAKALPCEVYRELKLFVDGKPVVPCDVNYSYVEPMNIDGTVYVPVRAIVEALGMSAAWDNDTRTVVIER